MAFSIKKILKSSLPLVLGVFLVWYSLSKVSFNELLVYFKEANYLWVGFGLLFGILSHLSRAYRWKFTLEPLGYQPRFANSAMAVLVAYLVNYTIPRAGEVSRAAVMTNYEGIPFEKGFGTIVAERIADLIMMLIIVAITLFVQFDFIYDLLLKNIDPSRIIILGLALMVVAAIFIHFIRKAKTGFALKIKTFVVGLIEGVTSIFKMKKKWPFIFHTLFIWLMYVLMFWATIPAIDGLEVPLGGVLIGFIAGGTAIAATNAGVGSYPVAVALAFALFNIDNDMAYAFGWIMWSAQTAMVILFGGLSFLFLPIYNKNKN